MAIAQPPVKTQSPEEDEEFYPSGDGKPMAETDKHVDLILYSKSALKNFFTNNPNVYISGNNFIFYERGNRDAKVSPDCYVVFGVPMQQRDSYFVWREGGRTPNVVFEFTSRSTKKEDIEVKRPL